MAATAAKMNQTKGRERYEEQKVWICLFIEDYNLRDVGLSFSSGLRIFTGAVL